MKLFSAEGPVFSGLIKLFDCICLSVLWFVCCLPVITIGVSCTALYTTVYKYIRREEGTLTATFFGALRENFRRSTLAGLVEVAMLALMAADILVFRSLRMQGEPLGGLYELSLILCCVVLTWTIYLAAYTARFNGTVREVLRFSVLLMIWHPIRTLEVFACLAAGLVLALGLPGMALVAPAGVYWLASILIEKVFLKHLRPEDTAAQAAKTQQEETQNER